MYKFNWQINWWWSMNYVRNFHVWMPNWMIALKTMNWKENDWMNRQHYWTYSNDNYMKNVFDCPIWNMIIENYCNHWKSYNIQHLLPIIHHYFSIMRKRCKRSNNIKTLSINSRWIRRIEFEIWWISTIFFTSQSEQLNVVCLTKYV